VINQNNNNQIKARNDNEVIPQNHFSEHPYKMDIVKKRSAKDNINLSEKEQVSSLLKNNPTFLLNNNNTPFPKVNRRVQRTHLILKTIKENPAITPYKLAKILEISYTEIARCIRDLEYVDAIISKINVTNNRSHKELFVPGVENE